MNLAIIPGPGNAENYWFKDATLEHGMLREGQQRKPPLRE